MTYALSCELKHLSDAPIQFSCWHGSQTVYGTRQMKTFSLVASRQNRRTIIAVFEVKRRFADNPHNGVGGGPMVTRRRAMQLFSTALICSSVESATAMVSSAGEQGDLGQAETSRQAKQLTEQLLVGIEKTPRNPNKSYGEKPNIYLADVEASVDGFGFQLRYCLGHHLPMWSAQFGNTAPVPVKWSVPIEASWEIRTDAIYQEMNRAPDTSHRFAEDPQAMKNRDRLIDALFEFYGSLAKTAVKDMGFALYQLAPEVAKENFANGLTEFVTTRLRAARRRPTTVDRHRAGFPAIHVGVGASPINVGLPFKVFTQKNSLRVRYTMAYFPDLDNPGVFGAPSSPVNGSITPGKWIFGTDGPDTHLRWDSGKFEVPPLGEARLNI
jgi:hypothetical protein